MPFVTEQVVDGRTMKGGDYLTVSRPTGCPMKWVLPFPLDRQPEGEYCEPLGSEPGKGQREEER